MPLLAANTKKQGHCITALYGDHIRICFNSNKVMLVFYPAKYRCGIICTRHPLTPLPSASFQKHSTPTPPALQTAIIIPPKATPTLPATQPPRASHYAHRRLSQTGIHTCEIQAQQPFADWPATSCQTGCRGRPNHPVNTL